MLPSYFYPSSSHQRRHSQSPSVFNYLDQSPYTPSYSLQPEPVYIQPNPHCYSSAQPEPYSLTDHHRHRSRPSGSFVPSQIDADTQARRAHQLRQLRQQRERELEQEAQYQRELSRLRNHPAEYQDAVRAERARRLTEAKERQRTANLAQQPDTELQVEVTLPDGRRCVVPLSWARKMQAKYPAILTDGMIQPVQRPSAVASSSPSLQAQPEASLAGDESSEHGSDFYVLDPTQDPSVPVLAPSSPSPSPMPAAPKHTPEERDAAARLIQHQFRLHQKLKHLDQLQHKFYSLKENFTPPSPVDLKFVNPPSEASSEPSTKLAFNIPANRPVQAFEESLLQLQIALDAIISSGNEKIKSWRKRLVKEVEKELEDLDRLKADAWAAQRVALTGKAEEVELADKHDEVYPMEGVEPTDEAQEITTTDTESVGSYEQHPQPADDGPSTPLLPRQEQEDIIIPDRCRALQAADTVLVPAHPASIAFQSDDNNDDHSVAALPSVVTPQGDILCPAHPLNSLAADTVLVSPI